MHKNPPKIVFPCRYPVKVLGRAREDFELSVMEIFNCYAPDFDPAEVQVKKSRNNTFLSITIIIQAQSEDQLRQLHKGLVGTGLVSMVI